MTILTTEVADCGAGMKVFNSNPKSASPKNYGQFAFWQLNASPKRVSAPVSALRLIGVVACEGVEGDHR